MIYFNILLRLLINPFLPTVLNIIISCVNAGKVFFSLTNPPAIVLRTSSEALHPDYSIYLFSKYLHAKSVNAATNAKAAISAQSMSLPIII